MRSIEFVNAAHVLKKEYTAHHFPTFSHGPVPYRGLIEGYKPDPSFQIGSQAGP